MNKNLILAAAVLALLLAACAPAGQGATTEQLTALEARVAALEAQAAAPDGVDAEDTPSEAGVFELAVAQYVMDTAGLHAMDEALHETGVVEASYISAVNRVAKVVGATTWPEELHGQVEAFETVLADLVTALEADDAAAAAELAASAHEVQHDLSGGIDEALGLDGHGH